MGKGDGRGMLVVVQGWKEKGDWAYFILVALDGVVYLLWRGAVEVVCLSLSHSSVDGYLKRSTKRDVLASVQSRSASKSTIRQPPNT
jgi:hypothetical protein